MQKRTFRVKTLSISGIGKKIYRNGDIINSNEISEDKIEQYLSDGGIEEIFQTETPEVPAPETPEAPAPETPEVPAPETPKAPATKEKKAKNTNK